VLEEAPVLAVLVNARLDVIAANAAARSFFGIDPARLPASLVEVTREGRLADVMRAGTPEGEARLPHHGRVVSSVLVPGPRPGETLMFLTDVTELRRLSTIRQEFVANLTHELKTPLTSLRLALEALAGNQPAEGERRHIRRALRDADHLASIVDNLRQLSEIEAGHVALKTTRFTVRDLVAEVAERTGLATLELHIPERLEIEADRDKTGQVLANMFDNARRFSPPGSPVEVSVSERPAEIELRVRDHGPGLSPEHWDRVFERFYKVDPARSRETGGSGLGLSIARHLVLVQGGRIWTETADEGGQVFAFTLPTPKP
jgi:two-component system phosphate regulon sensor histidine kinase PhoR